MVNEYWIALRFEGGGYSKDFLFVPCGMMTAAEEERMMGPAVFVRVSRMPIERVCAGLRFVW
jgi:hypothetical protein